MGFTQFLKGMFNQAPQPKLLAEKFDQPAVPDSHVHHEIMIGDPVDGAWPWLCRVYDENSAVTENTGEAATEQAAINAALSWATVTKASLRGAA